MREQTLDQPKDSEPPPRRHTRIHLLQELARTPGQIARVLGLIPSASHPLQSAPTAWSAHMVVAHLVHLEPLFLDRLRSILREDRPRLQALGPEQAPPVSHLTALDLLAEFHRRRAKTLDFLRSLDATSWHRTAVHETQGETDLLRQTQILVQHDTAHLGQLYDLRSMWQRGALRSTFEPDGRGVEIANEKSIEEDSHAA
jgi:uncharacterized damage-inducible protein DinB